MSASSATVRERKWWAVLMGCSLLLSALAVPAPAAATTSAQAIAFLNGQRAANGIPGGLVEEPTLSEGCRRHETNYVPTASQNPHDEVPGQPGYSEIGDSAAGSSDLSSDRTWSAIRNPWSGAPIHLAQLFDPLGSTAWYGEGPRGACMGTGGGGGGLYPGGGQFSLPGNGAGGVPSSEGPGGENPYTPAEAAGIRQEHGPTIIVWNFGLPAAAIAGATLTGPTGAVVPVRAVGPSTPSPPSNLATLPSAPTLGSYTPASFVIPERPLALGAHRLLVRWSGAGGAATEQLVTFSVTDGSSAAGSAVGGPVARVRLSKVLKLRVVVRRGRLATRLLGIPAFRGRPAKVRFAVRSCRRCKPRHTVRRVRLKGALTRLTGPRVPRRGRATVVASSPSFRIGAVKYTSARLTSTVRRR